MRKVFLDKLPRWQKGTHKSRINWGASIGEKVNFIYDDIEGKVEIVDYKDSYLTIKYLNEKPFRIHQDSFKKCFLGKLIGMHTNKFKYEIGQNFKDDKRNLTLIDNEYREYIHKPNEKGKICVQNQKWYKYRCNRLQCGYEGWIMESNLRKRRGCSCCAGKTVVLGINTIWDTDRWMCDLGVSEEDAKKYMKSSGEKIEVMCPDCKKRKFITISSIYTETSIGCACGKGLSRSEKFMVNVLNQLRVEFTSQLSKKDFIWCEKRRYDFYIPSLNMIIETHGEQHYKYTGFKRKLEEEQENDRIKKEVALSNGIDKYIVIDCRDSEIGWIKNSILNSELSKSFDLSNIDWSECEEFALKNIIKEVCEYWSNKKEMETTGTIAKNNPWGIKGKGTIREYLMVGAKYNWCNYNSEEEAKRIGTMIGKLNGKNVKVFKDDISLGVFESATEIERKSKELFGTKLNQSTISAVCLGKRKSHKGFTFKYIDESQQIAS